MSRRVVRVRDRSSLAALANGGLSSITNIRYLNAVKLFLQYLSINSLEAYDILELDELLNEYIIELYATGGSKSLAAHIIYGIYFLVPSFKNQLSISVQRLKAWNRLEPAVSHAPITYELTCLIAASMSKVDYHWCTYAVGALVAFDCYLRVGELVNLVVSDVAVPGDARLHAGSLNYYIRLGKTKTGRNQFVMMDNNLMGQLLMSICKGKQPSDKIFSFTATQFRSALHQTTLSLGLHHMNFVPHSFRHGAATRDYMLNRRTLTDILFRGRWKSTESAKTYVQCGQALLLLNRVPADIASLAAAVSLRICDVVQCHLQLHSSS
jgi:hypothetical protein